MTSSPFQIVLQDDHLPMEIDASKDVDAVLEVVWVSDTEKAEITRYIEADL
jgi:hypothetical protein